MSEEFKYLNLTELREQLDAKKVSSVELTKYFLSRIKNLDKNYNSFVTVTEEEALKDAKIADQFGALKTPHAYIVNGTGKIIYSGGVTNSTNGPNATKQLLKEALLSVKAGKNPEPSEVRTLGCVIARP
jgi:hypothetical protein